MLLHIALVAEILATIICFHCIYGKKLKWDVKTVAAVLSVLTVLEMVNYYHLSGIFSFLVYVILFIYCKYEFKSKFAETVISFVLCMILISSMQFIYMLLANMIMVDAVYLRNAVSNILATCIFIVLFPTGILHRLQRSMCKNSKFLIVLSGFICLVVIVILLQGKVFYKVEMQYFVLAIPAIIMLLYLIMKWYTAQTEAEKMEEEIRKVENNTKEYEDLLTKVRLRQHEFKNHIAAVFSAHYTYDTYEQLVRAQEEYCEKLLDENKYNNLLQLGDKVLVGYLYGKFQEAEEDGIEV